jgi:chloramphenicol 3-O phosphotransferase
VIVLNGPSSSGEMLTRTGLGYHRAVAALASDGNDVVMGYPLSERWRLDDLLDVLRVYDVTLVDIRCSLNELERRERVRGDRPVGLAKSQSDVFAHGDRDIVVDTTTHSPEACAAQIVRVLDDLAGPKAFDRLRGNRNDQPGPNVG